MPVKGGAMTHQEQVFADAYVATGDKHYAAEKAGYSDRRVGAHRSLAKPAVLAEIAAQQHARLFNEALPLAVGRLISIVQDARSPAGAAVQAAKLIFDRTLGQQGADGAKAAHEMTGEELQKAIDALRKEVAERSRTTIDVTPEPSVFE